MARRELLVLLFLLITLPIVENCGKKKRRSPPRDTTPPNLTCPGNIRVNNRPLQNHQMADWVEPIATDNGRSITPTRVGPPPGKLFNEGVTTITYSAKDTSGNTASCSFTITVNVPRCPPFSRQYNGYKVCHPSYDMRYGASCRFGCYTGFIRNGPDYTACLESGQWTVASQPRCDKRTCPALVSPANVQDVTCTDAHNFRSICSYNCKEGYGVPQGTSKVRLCGSFGHWIGREPSCVDVTKPVFTYCPYVIMGYAESTKTSGRVSWNLPTATDNSDEYVQPILLSGPTPGDDLRVGEHPASYIAIDSAGNSKTCNFNVIVKQIRCPTIYPLPYSSVVCPNGTILGSGCDFSCDEKSALKGESFTQCSRTTTAVPYGFWSFGSQPYCELTSQCPDMIPPANGAVACDTWLQGSYCQMFCQNGYVAIEARSHMILHVCDSDGIWPLGDELPDCFKLNSTLRFFKLEARFSHLIYNGSCTEDHAEIIAGFKQAFNPIYENSCVQDSTCVLTGFKILCGEQTESDRRKRQTSGGFIIEATMELDKEMSTVDVMTVRSETISALQSGVTIVVNGNEYTNEAVTATGINANCSTGSVFDKYSNLCVLCKQGYYHNIATHTCTKCAKGKYQDLTGKTSCYSCPEGQTTPTEGTISADQCQEACTLGMYSTYGTVPCSQCDLGTFANVTAATSCHTCPGMQTTLVPGATSVDQCQDMDIQYIELDEGDEAVPAMTTVNTTTAGTGLSAWVSFRFTNCSTMLNITDDDTMLFELTRQTGTDLRARVFGSTFTQSVSLLPDVWHYIKVDLRDSMIKLFIDDEQILSESVAELTGDWVPAEVNITLGGSECIGSFSQLHLNSTSGITSSSRASCFNDETGDLLSWKTFLETGAEGTFFKVHSQCDVINNCDSTPCQNEGVCTDLYLNYSCACVEGFTGSSCEVDLDDCQSHACDNNATCVDGANGYSCQCEHGFKGELCEIKVVDGNWAPWGNWSACSVSCGPGTCTRERVCTDPAPDNGGLECEGNSTETGTCQDRPDTDDDCVNECSEPPVVVNGNMNCAVDDTDGVTIVCTPQCPDGYDFDSDFMIVNFTIFCGLQSSFRWNIRNEDNPNMTLPTCMEKVAPETTTMVYIAEYSELHPDFVIDGGSQIEQVFTQTISTADCVVNGQCDKTFSHGSVDYSERERRSTIGTSVTMTVTCVASSSTAAIDECYNYLVAINDMLNAAVTNLQLTVTYNGVSHDININSTVVDGTVGCTPGFVDVLNYCIPCGQGMYQFDYYCERCPRGTYQDEESQTTCKQCPDGWTTYGLQSKNVTDCAVEVVTDDDIANIVLIIALVLAGFLIVVLLVVGWRFCHKQKAKGRPVTPTEDVPMADRNWNIRYKNSKTKPTRAMLTWPYPPPNISLEDILSGGQPLGATNDLFEDDAIPDKIMHIFTLPECNEWDAPPKYDSEVPPPIYAWEEK